MFPGIFFTRGDDVEFVWYDAPGGSMPSPTVNDLSTLQQEGWQPLGGASTLFDRESGFYHMTERWTSFGLHGDPPDELRPRLLARFVQRYDALPPDHEHRQFEVYKKIRELYGNGKEFDSRRLVTGYIRNTIALALLGLLIFLPTRGRTDLWHKVWQQRYIKRIKPGHCPACGYDARGLDTCPECGTERSTT
ncbi:MAG: hypothetical protein RIB58_03090 [Phycisphaerales bacterium]